MDANALTLLEATARRTPDKVCAIDERGSITYAGLRERARRIGSALVRAGAAGKPVVVALDKGIDALAACLGALYAGTCYVPVDPISAPSRLASVWRICEGPAIVTDGRTRGLADALAGDATVLDVRDLGSAPIDEHGLASIRDRVLDTDPAYILFTSGSTGAPKGVAVSHRAIVEFIASFIELFGIDETDVIGNQAPFDFDVSVKDIYGALASGATLQILPRRLFSEPAALVETLRKRHVTTLTWAVAALCLVSGTHALDDASLPDVRRVLFSGETMPARHLETWMERLPGARFVNLYGPTEVTCNCLYHEVDRARPYDDGIPLGAPFPNHKVLLLDERGRAVRQAGAVGELYVRSPQLALGYYGDPERTAASFIQNPLQERYPETVYRTGDLARLTASGELVFAGRRDNQVKHRGHRIELEEVDGLVERAGACGVSRCRCAYDGRRHRIMAFFEGEIDEADLAARCCASMPAHLVPSAIVRVESMPLSKNGKVDRRALLEAHAPRRARRTRPGA